MTITAVNNSSTDLKAAMKVVPPTAQRPLSVVEHQKTHIALFASSLGSRLSGSKASRWLYHWVLRRMRVRVL
jgi:hypothetical protein